MREFSYSPSWGHEVEEPDDVMLAAQLAAVLEVSAWPKPGNVHRMADLGPKTYERFLAGSLAIGPACRKAAERGLSAGEGRISLSEIGLGSLMEEAASSDGSWQTSGPSHTGFIILAIPLSASAGLLLGEGSALNLSALRPSLSAILEASTVEDAVGLYRAIRKSSSTKLGELSPSAEIPDVFSPRAEEELREKSITLLDVLKASSSWDLVSRELLEALRLSSDIGLPTFKRYLEETGSLNVAIVNTYLALLSSARDTHLARAWGLRRTPRMPDALRIGLEMAEEVSRRAGEALELGGAATKEGLRAVEELDAWLRSLDLNPGSCADLTACTLMLAILMGFRP